MHYTPAQTRWFLAAAEDQQLEAHRLDVQGARLAQAADGAVVAAYLQGKPLPAPKAPHSTARKR